MKTLTLFLFAAALTTGCNRPASTQQGSGPVYDASVLPSWNESKSRTQLMEFVAKVTDSNDVDYVKPDDRIAVFDNDGTLWAEQPMYSEGLFAYDQIKAMAATDPALRNQQPYKALLDHDFDSLKMAGMAGVAQIMMKSHVGNTTDEFAEVVRKWIDTARHPVTKKKYTEMTYQPMKELILYLQQHGFKVFIVSGGGIEFMRPWTAAVYNIQPENVIGSSVKTKLEFRGDTPVLYREAAIDLIDDGPGKPVGIGRYIGKRPIAAFGNSDGDLQMLQYVTAGSGARFGLIVHHTDSAREWAYDRQSTVGKLDKALDEAPRRGWTVVDMKNDWKTIY
ncbi:HAD family hydrolase [Chitinophaga lutea]